MKLLPYARSAAVATVIGASFFAGPLLAQPAAPGARPPAAQAATSSKPETVEQRITTLHNELKITPAEEAKWAPVAKAMRDNADAMDKLAQSKQASMGKMTAVDDMKTYQEFSQAHLDGLKNLTSAFSDLYNSMPDAQKKVADAAFQKYGSN